MATIVTGCSIRGAATINCRRIPSNRSEKRASPARPPWPRRMSSHSSRRAVSRTAATEVLECAGWLVEVASAPAGPAGSGMGRGFSGHFGGSHSVPIRYTEWPLAPCRETLRRLHAEVVEEADDEQLLVLLRRPGAVRERGLVREVAAVLDAPDEIVGRLDFERHRRVGQVLHDARREATGVVVELDARDDRDVFIGLVLQVARDALPMDTGAAGRVVAV